ncbi:MAG: helix-turn-helix domain-containing protein [Bacteroidetes bacterium]|nr:helix-turn-helix domain-containing protein [Bacteroidota bacterium]
MGTRELLEKILDVVNRLERLVSDQKDRVVDARTACRLTGLSKASLYSKTCSKNGEPPLLPHFKTGKRIYFRESDLVAWMTSHRVKDRDGIERDAEEYVRTHPSRIDGMPRERSGRTAAQPIRNNASVRGSDARARGNDGRTEWSDRAAGRDGYPGARDDRRGWPDDRLPYDDDRGGDDDTGDDDGAYDDDAEV